MLNRRSFGGLVAAAALLPAGVAAQSRLTLAAVNYPLAYFAERVAGDLADIVFPVPAGEDPSFWRPGIADISAFQSADLILLNGAGFADWVARTTLPRSRIVRTAAGFEDAFIATETVTHSHGDGGEHSHTGTASYLWLDFAQAAQQADAIAAALTRIAPEAQDAIAANLAALRADLDGLDAAARALGAPDAPMIASHPRYQYFARAYGLTLDAVDWDAVAPPSEAQWQTLETLADNMAAKIFLWEAAPDAALLTRMEALGLTNVIFPPLANRPAEGDFVSSLRASIAALSDAVAVVSEG